MTTISGATYSNLYSYANSNLSDQLDTTASSTNEKETVSTARTEDSVTLSSEISTARTREYFGLQPTGRLSMADLKSAITDQKDTVSQTLSSVMQELGIDTNQAISLSLDDNNNIVVEGNDFPGKSELEDALNEDDTFVQAFRGLSANNEVIDYISSLQTNQKSLLNYMNSDSNDEDLLTLAAKYSSINSGKGSIETLWSMGRNETPYTYNSTVAG